MNKPVQNRPVVMKQSGWAVNLGAFSTSLSAEKELNRLKKEGVNAGISNDTTKGKVLYRVQVTGFSNYKAAKKHADILKSSRGIMGAWVGKAG